MVWTSLQIAIAEKLLANDDFKQNCGDRFYVSYVPSFDNSEIATPFVSSAGDIEVTPWFTLGRATEGEATTWPFHIRNRGNPSVIRDIMEIIDDTFHLKDLDVEGYETVSMKRVQSLLPMEHPDYRNIYVGFLNYEIIIEKEG